MIDLYPALVSISDELIHPVPPSSASLYLALFSGAAPYPFAVSSLLRPSAVLKQH